METLSKDERENHGILVSGIGILSNIVLFIFKMLMGYLSNSISITADAINNLSDAGSCGIAMISFKFAKKPADKKYPFGYGRMEYISGLIVALFILIAGVELIVNSISKILHPSNLIFNWPTLIMLVLAIMMKLGIGLFSRRASKKINSISIHTLALDSLCDALITTITLFSYLIAFFFNWQIDGYAGLTASSFILWSGFKAFRNAVKPLLGQCPDSKVESQIKAKLLENKDIMQVHDLMVHDYGPNRSIASVHVVVPSNKDLIELHDELFYLQKEIEESLNIYMNIHLDPAKA
jgi:cation diffusion facilitator family transporter